MVPRRATCFSKIATTTPPTPRSEKRHIGLYDTQESAAHAVNAAIRRAGLAGKRHTNPVVDGQLVPKKRKANGHGRPRDHRRRAKRRREEPAATPSTRARHQRRTVNYAEDPDYEP